MNEENKLQMKKSGFTLVELLTAIVIGLVIMAAIYGAMIMAQNTSANLGRKTVTQQDTRAVLDFMASEIRMASLSKKALQSTWNTFACGLVNPLNKGIQVATPTTLAVAMDLNNDGQIGVCTCGACCGPPNSCTNPICAGTNEFIIYSYNNVDSITREVGCGGPAPAILGGTAPDSNVRNTVAIPLFQYFDRNDLPLPAPVNIPFIRRIKITIVSETAQNDINTGQPRTMIHSTDVIVRNHAILHR